MATVRALLAEAQLPGDSPRLEAELLLAHCIERERSWLHCWPQRDVAEEAGERYRVLLQRRRAGEPIAYLLQQREFWSLSLRVNPHTLIPRPETETLVAWALELDLPETAQVADLGTGSGAIALALAAERPGWSLLAVDRSADALAVAALNRRALGINNLSLSQGHWSSALAVQSCSLLVSNPPYVAEGDEHLRRGDLRFEPALALEGGSDGLQAIRALLADAPRVLRPGGWLLLEHGADQAAAVAELLAGAGFGDLAVRRDLAGLERCSGGCWHAQ